jgi:hypothetical protein
VPRPVPRAGEEEGEYDGEGQHPAVLQHGEEDPAADQGEQDGRQRLAVDAAGEQLAHLVLVLVVGRDEQPGEAVEDQTEAAGRGEHRQGDPEDHRVQVALPSESGAHPGEHLVPPVPPEGVRRAGHTRSGRGSRGGRGAPRPGTRRRVRAGAGSRTRRGVLVFCHASMVTGAMPRRQL